MSSRNSSILYQNSQQTAFIIDLPASIELAQISRSKSQHVNDDESNQLTRELHHRQLYCSTKSLDKPYSSPPEPKSQEARARLLARIPASESLFHASISRFITEIYDSLKREFQGHGWCKPRKVRSIDAHGNNIATGKSQKPEEQEKKPPRKKIKTATNSCDERDLVDILQCRMQPPLMLSPSSVNAFSDISDLCGIQVKNSSRLESAMIYLREEHSTNETRTTVYTVPPRSSFVLDNISANQPYPHIEISPIPGLSPTDDKFNIILFDPPWPNRSVRRSSQYPTHGYLDMDSLISTMQSIILTHLDFNEGAKVRTAVGIWTTNNARSRQAAYNAFENTGLEVFEMWIWVKTTENGELVSPLEGLWRKPYEVFFLGRPKTENTKNKKKKTKMSDDEEKQEPFKRIIAAVPDEHSRKPNLKELIENLICCPYEGQKQDQPVSSTTEYSVLEVFARNLTAGWTACGNDVLKFNADQWWFQPEI